MSTSDSGTSALTRQEIRAWPKADLHTHLDGSPRLETMLDIARSEGKMDVLPADDVDGLRDALRAIDESETLESYLDWFQYTIPLMQTKTALRRIAYELVAQNAEENVRYLEVRYAPILHIEEGLTLEEVNDTVLQGLARGEEEFDVKTSLIICGLRDRYESASMRQAELASAYRHRGVVAFDLAGGEAGNPPKGHLHAFYHARNNLLNLTVHAGESWGPDSIRQAIFYCGAHRIGHGITLQQDPELMQYFVDHRIPLEICPTSNVQTHVVPSLDEHPITTYVEAGVPVTVNTDSRLFSRTSVTDELWRVHKHCGVPADRLREIALNGFRYAFLPFDEKKQLFRGVLDAFPMASMPEPLIW
jgi:adenosine deaminase